MMRPLPAFLLALAVAAPATAQNLAMQTVNGVDAGIDVPTDPLLVPPTGITVEAWIAYDDRTLPTGVFNWPTIARQNIAAGQEVWNFRVAASNNNSRNLTFTVKVNGANQNVGYTFAVNEFVNYTHVAGTFDGQTIKIYKNGVQVATRTLTTTTELVNTNGILRIGNGDPVSPGREVWNGLIDELRIWPMARTQPEIQATMNQALNNLAGGVVTFSLDGHGIDVSNGLIGTQFGSVGFIPGGPTVTTSPTMANLGTSSTLCPRPIRAALGSMPKIGNSAFAIWATRGPVPASSPFGILFGSAGAAPPGINVLGIDLAIDPFAIFMQTIVLPPTGILGNARSPLPIPFDNALVGASPVFQWAFADAACGPQGWSASNGIQFTVF